MARTTATLTLAAFTAGAGIVAGAIWHERVADLATRLGVALPHVAAPEPMSMAREPAATPAEPQATIWYCPMHPSYRSDRPGNCPICNMKLVPLEGAHGESRAPTTGGHAAITLDPERRQRIGVKVAPAETRRMTRSIRAAGRVDVDERGLSAVALKYGGWIEQLFVETTGEPVHKGQPLLRIYSPELYQAELNYRAARTQGFARGETGAGAEDPIVTSARDRLRLWDVTDEQISALDAAPPDVRSIVFSKVDGVVTRRDVVEGAYVEPGATLFDVADLSKVWILADLFADEANGVAVGQAASIETVAETAQAALQGRVAFVYPELNEATRTVRVRIEADNPDGRLRPGLYASVAIEVDLGEHVVMDDGAVLDTGTRQLVFVDEGEGKLAPREVRLGARSGGSAIVLEGLAAGESVVTSGNFLVDSESRLQAALGSSAPAAGDAPAPPSPPAHEHGGGR